MTRYGKTEVLDLRDIPDPHVKPDEVLIEVHAASLNPLDYKIRDGMLRRAVKVSFPQPLGHDVAGTVVRVGADVGDFKAGDAVYGVVAPDYMGTFAEFVVARDCDLAPIPDNVSFVEAASLPLVALTCWQAMVELMYLREGQRILIQAGAGGVGSFAIQLAKSLGAHVTATAGPDNQDFMKDLGADETLNYKATDFTSLGPVFDAVLDTMGGSTLYKSFKVVKPGGWVVSLVSLPDPETAAELELPLIARGVLRLATRKVRAQARKAGAKYRMWAMGPNGRQLRWVTERVNGGKIRPVIDSTYSLNDYADAFARLESHHARGKVVFDLEKHTQAER